MLPGMLGTDVSQANAKSKDTIIDLLTIKLMSTKRNP